LDRPYVPRVDGDEHPAPRGAEAALEEGAERRPALSDPILDQRAE
jgi:hypothetical protein